MTIPKIYRSDDTGAPDYIGNNPTAWCDLIRACLVDGYGTQTPPGNGYTLDYINAEETAIALRSTHSGSNGHYYCFRSGDAYGTNAYAIYGGLFLAENMTDAETAINTTTQRAMALNSDTNSDFVARPWVMIADDRFIYFFANHLKGVDHGNPVTAGRMYANFGMGDFISFDPTDPWSSVVHGAQNSTGEQGSYFGEMTSSEYNTTALQIIRPAVGTQGYSAGCLLSGGGPFTVDDATGVMGGIEGGPAATYDPDNLPVWIARPLIVEPLIAAVRGYFPGLYYPCHNQPFSHMVEQTINGRTFLPITLRVSSDNNGQCLIETGVDWWE